MDKTEMIEWNRAFAEKIGKQVPQWIEESRRQSATGAWYNAKQALMNARCNAADAAHYAIRALELAS